MELRHLRYLVALAEQLNFTRAAAKAHVAQSTLSHQIKQLEDEIGYRLFHRIGKRVTLTTAGDLLLPSVTRALREIDDGLRALRDSASGLTGEVRFAVAAHVFGIAFIPQCVSTFMAAHPHVRIKVENLPRIGNADKIRTGEIDFAVGDRPPDDEQLWFEPLYQEELALVVRQGHPLATRKRVRVVELHHQSLMLPTADIPTRQVIDECFRAARTEPTLVAEISTVQTLLQLARTTIAGTILSRNAAEEMGDLVVISLEDPTPKRTVGFVWRRGEQPSLPVRAFASVIRHTIEAVRPQSQWPHIEPYAATTSRSEPVSA